MSNMVDLSEARLTRWLGKHPSEAFLAGYTDGLVQQQEQVFLKWVSDQRDRASTRTSPSCWCGRSKRRAWCRADLGCRPRRR